MSELFLKNEKVLTIKDIEGVPSEIVRIDNPELLPLCLSQECTSENLMEWLNRRIMPNKREGLDDVKSQFGNKWLNSKNYLSLTDQYWVKKRDEQWCKINFFDNRYSTDVGDMFFIPWKVNSKKINPNSPDVTTGGALRKRWIQNPDKKSSLAKAGSYYLKQEPLAEVLVSVLVEKLGVIKSAGYSLHIEGTTMCSICDNFITTETDLVPAYYIYNLIPKTKKESTYCHLIRVCEKFEIPGAKEYIDWVLFIDRITGQRDRNLSNIAFIRDIKTMKFIGPSPLFDCGNAYIEKTDDAFHSKMFGDVESQIFDKLEKQCDLENLLLKDNSYIKLIDTYPSLPPNKKDVMKSVIKTHNEEICKSRNKIYGSNMTPKPKNIVYGDDIR